jgi:hypothetical protein
LYKDTGVPTNKEQPGANPTIASYNASAAKINNATSSLVYYESKNILFFYVKRSTLLPTTLALQL